MPNARISGHYGFTIIPDSGTIEIARELSGRYAPTQPRRDVYHIPLYFTNFLQVNLAYLLHILKFLREDLVGTAVAFGDIVPYGGRFLHWRVDPVPKGLKSAHFACLGFSCYRDLKASPLQKDEQLQLTMAEWEALEEFGYPSAGPLFVPHLTLAGDLTRPPDDLTRTLHLGYVKDVHLVRIGKWESIENVVTGDTCPSSRP